VTYTFQLGAELNRMPKSIRSSQLCVNHDAREVT